MNVAAAASSALAAAALFAVATAVQSRAVRDTGGHGGLAIISRAMSSRAWLAGAALAAVGFGLHAVALHEGDLTVVQPLLVTMVLFALPAGRMVGGTVVTRDALGWATLLVLGLAAFFVAADPVTQAQSSADLLPAVITSTLAALAVVLCAALARRRAGGEAAALLGAGAGIAFAGVAALIKSSTDLLAHGVVTLASGWQPYAALAVGATGILLCQLAYRVGPLAASVPAMNCVNPLVSVLIGVVVFDEHIRTGAVASSIETIGLATVAVATLVLSRLPRREDRLGTRTPSRAL